MGTVVERFAEWAVAFRAQPLPAEVVRHAKRAVVDLHAAMISGAVEAPATLLEKALAEELDRGEARLALGRRATVRAAGLINGAAARLIHRNDRVTIMAFGQSEKPIRAKRVLLNERNEVVRSEQGVGRASIPPEPLTLF